MIRSKGVGKLVVSELVVAGFVVANLVDTFLIVACLVVPYLGAACLIAAGLGVAGIIVKAGLVTVGLTAAELRGCCLHFGYYSHPDTISFSAVSCGLPGDRVRKPDTPYRIRSSPRTLLDITGRVERVASSRSKP